MSETSTIIQARRGLKANLPAECAQGELLFCLDTHELFFGMGTGTPPVELAAAAGDADSIAGVPVDPTHPTDGAILIYDGASGKYIAGDPIVSGPDAPGVAPTKPPVQIGIIDSGGHVQRAGTSNPVPVSGSVAVSNFPATQPVSAAALPLPTGAATETSLGTDGAAPPSIPGTGIRGWLRSIYDTLKATLTVSVSNFPGTQPVSGSVSVSNFPATQPVSAAALPLPAGAATETSMGTDGAAPPSIPGTGIRGWLRSIYDTLKGTLTQNVAQWGTTNVAAAATTSPVGTEAAPVVRNLPAKTFRVISTTNPTTSATVYYGPNGMQSTRAAAGWFDTQQTGASSAEISFFANAFQSAGSDGCYVDSCDDQVNGPFTQLGVVTAASGTIRVNLPQRYWQVRYINGTSVVSTFTLNSSEWQGAVGPFINPTSQAQVLDGNSIIDGNSPIVGPVQPNINVGSSTRSGPGAFVPFLATGPSTTGPFAFQRTPNIAKTVAATATGSTALWTPTAGKKFRLMRFKIIVTANASLAAGGVFTIDLLDAAASLNLTHSIFVPTTAGSTIVGTYDSDWIDLGNGLLSALANNVLNVNLSAALVTGAVRVIVCGTEE
jgi:hypothetical protein